MTRDEILAMELGRELDALVADKVMGWHTFSPIDPTCDHAVGVNGFRKNFAFDPTDDKNKPIRLYSTDISAAWEVLEKFPAYEVKRTKNGVLQATIMKNGRLYFHEDDVNEYMPSIICKAALLTVLD